MKSLKYFSLFSGIGGFESGIQQAYESLCNANRSTVRRSEKNPARNKRKRLQSTKSKNSCSEKRSACASSPNFIDKRPLCVGYSEIDKYATQIYQSHFPDHKNYEDIRKINTGEIPDFDFLIGGFPCQSFSIAGKRLGFNDTRGTLFFEIARILRDKKPKCFLLENVKGLLSHDNGKTFRIIIATLDALGYDTQWQVLNSKNFGVPQNRERIFIVGHLRGTSRPQVFPIGSDNHANIILPTLTARYWGAQANGGYISEKPSSHHKFKLRRLTPIECERLQGFPDGWTQGISDSQRYKCLGNAVTVPVIKTIMQRMIA